MKNKIGIVTVLYNSESVIEDFFKSLDIQTFKDFILYVIDNNSPDFSLKKSKDFSQTVSFKTNFIENCENYGVAKGNNQGITAALKDGCEYILLSNNDVVLNEKTIEILLENHIKLQADISVPKIFLADGKKLYYGGGKIDFFHATSPHYGYNKIDDGSYNKIRTVKYAPTCFMLINKNVFQKVGLMDEKYFVYYDDTDFIFRAVVKNKLKLWYIPVSYLIHKESVCTGLRSDFFYKFVYRNRIYFVKKNYTFPLLFIIFEFSYHYLIRRIKMRNNKHQWHLIGDAIKAGIRL